MKREGEGEQPELPFETHPKNNVNKNFSPKHSDSAHESMPKEEALAPNKIKIDLGQYCPVCTPIGYRCVCHEQESEWDDNHEQPHQQIPKARIETSWFFPEETKKMPHSNMLSNCTRPERRNAWNLIGMWTLIKSQTMLPSPMLTEGNLNH